MKVAINVCFGGFGLSREGVRRLAELQGRACFFFQNGREPNGELDLYSYVPAAPAEGRDMFWTAFDIPNPNELVRGVDGGYEKHAINDYRVDRADPLLIRVIEELGERANGACSKLRVVEIPDGVEYEIAEYDGNEHIAEKHRTWS